MKLTYMNIKALILSSITLVAMSGCGLTGSSSDSKLVEGSVQGVAQYEIPAHHNTTAVVHSHTDATATHEWTQTSGPTVVLSTTTAPTTTFVVPTTTPPTTPPTTPTTTTPTTTPIVLQHTTTNTQTGVTTVTPHTIIPVPPKPSVPLAVLVGKPKVVFSSIGSLHASAFGGTAPYTYDWIAPNLITLDTTHPNAPTFIVPSLPVGNVQTLTIGLQVMDANGDTVTSNEIITITSQGLVINVPQPLREVNNSSHGGAGHQVGRGPAIIMNPLPGETYTWSIKDDHAPAPAGGAVPITDLKVSIAHPDGSKVNINFSSPAVTVETTYRFKLDTQNNSGSRVGTVFTEITVKP